MLQFSIKRYPYLASCKVCPEHWQVENSGCCDLDELGSNLSGQRPIPRAGGGDGGTSHVRGKHTNSGGASPYKGKDIPISRGVSP